MKKYQPWIVIVVIVISFGVLFWPVFARDIAWQRVINKARAAYATKGIVGVSEYCGTARGHLENPLAEAKIIRHLGRPFKCHSEFGPFTSRDGEYSAYYLHLLRYSDGENAQLVFEGEGSFTLEIFPGREY